MKWSKIFLWLAVCFFSLLNINSAEAYSGGLGTADEPYQIASSADLIAMGGDYANYSKFFILVDDIDLSASSFDKAVIAPDLLPDAGFQGQVFSGVFDGDGHTIAGLNISGPSNNNIGLFGVIDTVGKVQNLILDGVSITGNNNVGAVCGFNRGTVLKCSLNSGSIEGNTYVGGLVGRNYFMGTELYGFENNYSSISHSYGAVISLSSANADVTGASNVGGFCGENVSSIVADCYCSGTVTGGQYVGGFCGSSVDDGFVLTVRYDDYEYAAFLCSVYNCYSTSTVIAEPDANVHGFIGQAASSPVSYYSHFSISSTKAKYDGFYGNFWDVDTSGISYADESATGLITTQMQSQYFYINAGWDFINETANGSYNTWVMDTYPVFLWQSDSTTVPDIVGMALADVESVLTDNDLVLGNVLYQYSTELPENTVITQSIAAGTIVGDGVAVDITVATTVLFTGSGSLEDPYLLSNANDISNFINLDSTYADKCFMLTADIDMSANVFYNHGFDYPFSGTFDGNDHTISNLTIRNISVEDAFICSLTPTGVIKNLVLDNIYVSNINGGYFSTLCSINNGHIKHCAVTGEVYTQGYNVDCPLISSGGLCALNGGLIEQCYTNVLAQNVSVYGGICGLNYTSIDQCYSVGQIIPDNLYFPANIYGIADGGPVTNSFWDIETTGTTEGHGTGLTTEQMTTQSTFTDAGWDFVGETANGTDDVWFMDGYPRFATQDPMYTKIPDISGMVLEQARATLESAGLTVCSTSYVESEFVFNTVLEQLPAADSIIKIGGCVQLTLSNNIYFDGAGTESDPYQVSTVDQIVHLDDFLFSFGMRDGSEPNIYFALTSDLDFSDHTFDDAVIANMNILPFIDVFDGNGHMIRNLNISGENYIGLFGILAEGGFVKNLGLENVYINGDSCVGAICGKSYGKIINCFVTGIVIGDADSIGGICGLNYSGRIDRSYFSGYVNGYARVGGICGYNWSAIGQCWTSGTISGWRVGGICGENYELGSVWQCYSAAQIYSPFTYGSELAGVICGYQNSNYASITDCYWDAQLCGWFDGYVLNSYQQGTVNNVLGKTTEEMMTVATYTESVDEPNTWDFSTVDGDPADWQIRDGFDYPHLAWQVPAPGDIAGSWAVDMADLEAMSAKWLVPGDPQSADLLDFAELAENWLK